MDALDRSRLDRADGREKGTQVGGVLGQRGYDLDGGVEPRGHGGSQPGVVGHRALSGREVLGQQRVDRADRLTQPLRLAGEVAADLVGEEVGLGEQVAHAGQRELPPVAGGAEELLQHRELQDGAGRVRVALDPAQQRGDVLRAGPRQHVVDLDVGVGPRRDPAEDLQQGVLPEGHRGVRLLTGERRGRRGRVQSLTGQPLEAAEAVRRVGEGAQVRRHRLAVVDGVVGVGPADLGILPPADERMVEPVLRLGVESQRHLVQIHVAVRVGHLGEVDDDARVLVGDDAQPAYAGHPWLPALAAEPAGSLDVLGELSQAVVARRRRWGPGHLLGRAVGAGLVRHGAGASSGGAVRRNQ